MKKIMLVCGEPSGDQLGAELMRGLKALAPDVQITGTGRHNNPIFFQVGTSSMYILYIIYNM